MIRYIKYLGVIFLFLILTNMANAAAAAGPVDDKSPKGPVMSSFMEGLVIFKPKPTKPFSGKGASATLVDSMSRRWAEDTQALTFDATEEVSLKNGSGHAITRPIETLDPLRKLLQAWAADQTKGIPFNLKASVKDNFILMIHVLGAFINRLAQLQDMESKGLTGTLSIVNLEYFMGVEKESKDDESPIEEGYLPTIATVAPLKDLIKAYAADLPFFDPDMSVRVNMEALYAATCSIQLCYERKRLALEKR